VSVDQRAVHALDARRELRLTRVVVGLTIAATLLPAAGALLDLADSLGALAWGRSLTALLFLAVLGALAYGVFVYHLTRLGHLTRTLAHRPASDDELARLHDPTSPLITILVPSYREDAAVVRKTLLSAALQDYPCRRLVLLIDDPPEPAQLPHARGLVACRRLPHEVAELLSAPGAWTEAGLRAP
jgi:hypothetical protein